MAKAQAKVNHIPAADDTRPSDQYRSVAHLLRDAKHFEWTSANTGRKLLQYFGHLVILAKKLQHGDCAKCANLAGQPLLTDPENIGVLRGTLIHRTCFKRWYRWTSSTDRTINRSLKAYHDNKYPS